MAKAPVPTAHEINEAHQLARSCAETAIQHAIRCGHLLAAKKQQLGHGPFGEWVETYCKFSYRSARAYMQTAEKVKQISGSALPISGFSSLRQALGYDKPKPSSPKGAVPVVKAPDESPKATGETGNDRPAAPHQSAPPASPPPIEGEPPRPEWEPDADDILAETERQIAASTDKVMAADDKLAAAHAEIKRQAAEIAVLKLSRDGAMNARAAAIKQLQAEQRKVARLEKELGKGRKAA